MDGREMSMRFEGKVAVVTGAATGIGRATALAFGREGASVALADVNAEAMHETARAIEAAGGSSLAVLADVSRGEDARRIAADAVDRFGGVDYLIASAGIQTYGTVVDTDEDTWDRTLAVNLKGVYLAAKYCIPEMVKRGGGAIVNVASVQGLQSQPNVAAYAASKGALNTLTLSLARALAPEIRVNTVAPGFITGRWWREKMGEGYDKMVANTEAATPLKRAGTPEDMAAAAVWLLCGDVNITGEILISDAGMHLGAAPLKAR